MTNPMPTPNIPDEVVRAAQAAEEKFWAEDSNYPGNEVDFDSQAMLDKATRLMLEAAIPLLFERRGEEMRHKTHGADQWIHAPEFKPGGRENYERLGWTFRPLYRLKVSNQ